MVMQYVILQCLAANASLSDEDALQLYFLEKKKHICRAYVVHKHYGGLWKILPKTHFIMIFPEQPLLYP